MVTLMQLVWGVKRTFIWHFPILINHFVLPISENRSIFWYLSALRPWRTNGCFYFQALHSSMCGCIVHPVTNATCYRRHMWSQSGRVFRILYGGVIGWNRWRHSGHYGQSSHGEWRHVVWTTAYLERGADVTGHVGCGSIQPGGLHKWNQVRYGWTHNLCLGLEGR